MKKLLTVLACSLFSMSVYSSHIVGGDITIKSLGNNKFQITLHFFRDCNSSTAFDVPLPLGIFDKKTDALILTDSMKLISHTILTLGDSCFRPPNLCVEEGIFIDTVNLPNNPNGYYLSWERCCRNAIINNITAPSNTGMVFYAEIPDPAMNDSSPVFGSYPKGYMCVNQPNILNFGATDSDGDSLVYLLVKPYAGHTSGAAPIAPTPIPAPYDTVTFAWPAFGMFNIVGGSPAMSINSKTGQITAQPSALGVYVFCVEVDEYRSHVKIGEIRRDIQIAVLPCSNNLAPVFISPPLSTYSITAGETLCLTIAAEDADNDWVTLNGTSEMFNNSSGIPKGSFASDSAQKTAKNTLCLKTDCSNIRTAPYKVIFNAKDYSCYPSNATTFELNIFVKPPIDGKIDSLLPNIFTPNGDGLNDFFQISTEHLSTCLDNFNIQIFDRWGVLIFSSNDFHFKWDGNAKTGKEVAAGVYYYVLKGNFSNSAYQYKGFVHLER
jgi:gliding motility-associated-like protein